MKRAAELLKWNCAAAEVIPKPRPSGEHEIRLDRTAMVDVFRSFFSRIEPIRLKEPLAQTLGAFKDDGVVLEYSFAETVKTADPGKRRNITCWQQKQLMSEG